MEGLSKSRYTAFCQCPKNLWLKVFKPEVATVDDALQARFEQGNEVGDLAIYPKIAKMSQTEADAARRSLLEYCKLDTLAMVKVWEKLKEMAE
jgi:hypothetical protein